LHIKAKKYAARLSDEPMRCPFSNELFVFDLAEVEREPTEDSLQAEAMQEACGMFLTAERKFQKLNANPDCVIDSRLNCEWWDASNSRTAPSARCGGCSSAHRPT
jgi:hypothetical protein